MIVVACLSTAGRVADPPINEMCPVMPDEKADPAITTVYKGRTVAFCCEKCFRKFTADPEKYADRLPALAVVEPSTESVDEKRVADMLNDAAPAVGSTPPATVPSVSARVENENVDERAPLLARFHPAIVHFPVAGLPLALFGFLFYRWSGRPVFAAADVVPLLVTAPVAILAVISGNMAEGSSRYSASMRILVERHQFAGTTLMILTLVLSALRIWRWNRMSGWSAWVYGGGLIVACLVAAVAGYLGGSIVFGPDHLRL